MSITHHVCNSNSHKWACGKCLHEPMQLPGEGREWLSAESPAAEVLRKSFFMGDGSNLSSIMCVIDIQVDWRYMYVYTLN